MIDFFNNCFEGDKFTVEVIGEIPDMFFRILRVRTDMFYV